MDKKKIVFLTGTRADFGKLKSLIAITQTCKQFDVHIFATGMHMNSKYGKTVDEIFKSKFQNIFMFINHDSVEHMDRTLARTVDGFSHFVRDLQPHLIVVHGDRVEALAGAIVGSLNNILVAHVEGGELSGTVDEILRHAVSKMAHLHFVANDVAHKRLLQLGEAEKSVFVIGSPDLDVMTSSELPDLNTVKARYQIPFERYSIAMFHPVTTERAKMREHAREFVEALMQSRLNYVVIYPNNDVGSEQILDEYQSLAGNKHFAIFPSIRFEYFLTLLKHARLIIGNSSAGIREAPFYGVPTINIGSRQSNRGAGPTIMNVSDSSEDILRSIRLLDEADDANLPNEYPDFGSGGSDQRFLEILLDASLWETSHQKEFCEIDQ